MNYVYRDSRSGIFAADANIGARTPPPSTWKQRGVQEKKPPRSFFNNSRCTQAPADVEVDGVCAWRALLDQISQLAWRALCFISLAVKRVFVFIGPGRSAAMATLTDSFFQSSFL
jgi:hypothetical protein